MFGTFSGTWCGPGLCPAPTQSPLIPLVPRCWLCVWKRFTSTRLRAKMRAREYPAEVCEVHSSLLIFTFQNHRLAESANVTGLVISGDGKYALVNLASSVRLSLFTSFLASPNPNHYKIGNSPVGSGKKTSREKVHWVPPKYLRYSGNLWGSR